MNINLLRPYSNPILTAQVVFKWYKNNTEIIGANSSSFDVKDVLDSGSYTCDIANTIGGFSSAPVTSAAITVNVSKKDVTIAADPKTKTYGEADPALTWTDMNGGLVQGETLNGTLTRTAGDDAGQYVIGQGTVNDANNPNYHITFQSGAAFTIKKATGSSAVVMDSWKVGAPASDPVFSALTGYSATVEYKAKDASDSTYTTAKPTAAGEYTVRVTYTATDDNHNDFKVTANFTVQAETQAETTYTVTVINGAADKAAAAMGAAVNITAGRPPAGQTFDKWTSSDGVAFADASAASTTFTMPAKAVTVTATYKALPAGEYAITVQNDGNGTANAKVGSANASSATEGAAVTLTATPNEGYAFKEWQVISGGATIASANSATATFTMPANSVTVKAVFVAVGKENPGKKGLSTGAKVGIAIGAVVVVGAAAGLAVFAAKKKTAKKKKSAKK